MEFRQCSLESVAVNKKFWKNKRVLITGHTGVKGSWLSIWLKGVGANVIGYSLNPPTKPSLFEVADVERNMVSTIGDIRDLEYLKTIVKDNKPEIIIHMAAQALVRYSYIHPVETYSTNVMGTVNLLEAVRTSKDVRVVIVVTSDKCYKNNEWLWGYRENEPMGGKDPYSSSKGCAELVTSAYRNSFFNKKENDVSIASVRSGNVICGGDWAKDRLIPDIMNAFMESRPVVIRCPNATRPWQHVLEPLNGYLCLVEHIWEKGLGFVEAVNFGPDGGDIINVSEIVEHLVGLWGDGVSWKNDSGEDFHEANYLKLDCSKAKSLLKWTPKLNIETALKWIVEWYRCYQQNENMHDYTEAEIVRYQEL